MNEVRANSSPNLASALTTPLQPYDDSALEGVAAHIKLLLKLIQDHKDACGKGKTDSRRMLRVATMMTILDNVRTRLQKSQAFGNNIKRSDGALPPCNNTDLRLSHPKVAAAADEKEKLRRELTACMSAQKSLEMMCSSLGKEKEIMAAELSRKVHELNEMEELVSCLKAQNQQLVKKVQECASHHKNVYKRTGGGELHGNAAVQERNKYLSGLVMRSDDECRMMKKKLEDKEEANEIMRCTIGEMWAKTGPGLERVRTFKDHADFDEIMGLENIFECFKMMVAKHDHSKKQRGFY